MKRGIAILSLICVVVISFTHVTDAATTNATPGVHSDNQMSGTSGDDTLWNRGGMTLLGIGRSGNASVLHRSLLKFDFTSVPTNAYVTSASLQLTCNGQFSTANNIINAYRLIRPWSEGTSGDGTFNLNVDSSWVYANYPTTWGTAGAGNTSSDRTSDSLGSMTIGNACASQNHTMSFATTTVQSWIQDGSTNYGMVLIGDESVNSTNKTLASSEHATVLYRPKLSIAYDLIPSAPSSLGPTELVDGSFVASTTPNVRFTQVDNDGADTLRYHVQIDDTSDFSSPVVNYISDLISQGATSFTVGQAAGSGTYLTGNVGQTMTDGSYYWRVLSNDGTASSTQATANSGSIAFKVDMTPPLVASFATSPTAQSSSAIAMITTATTDAGEGAVEYQFQETSGNIGASSSGWQASSSYTDSDLFPCTTYTYTVSVRDGLGNTRTGSTASARTNCLGGGLVIFPSIKPSSIGVVVSPLTTSPAIIFITYTYGPDIMNIATSNYPDFREASYETPTHARTWTLLGTGERTVYVRFRSSMGVTLDVPARITLLETNQTSSAPASPSSLITSVPGLRFDPFVHNQDIAKERAALNTFRLIMKRLPNSATDWTSLHYLVYGGTLSFRDLSLERQALATYRKLFRRLPTTFESWRILHVLAYGTMR